jgi:hypothetical protein
VGCSCIFLFNANFDGNLSEHPILALDIQIKGAKRSGNVYCLTPANAAFDKALVYKFPYLFCKKGY